MSPITVISKHNVVSDSPKLLPSTASPQHLVYSMGEQLTWAAAKHSISPHSWYTEQVNNTPELLPSTAALQQLVHRTGEQLTWVATKHSIFPTVGT